MTSEEFLKNNSTIIIGFFTIVINLIIFSFNYRLSKDQTFRDLFREFNKRFDDLNESLNEIVDGYSDSRRDNKVIQDYLNLCSEEYLWRKKKRIEKEVWRAWEAGILDYLLKSEKIKDYFIKEEANDKSYYGFIKYIIPKIPKKLR